MSGQRAALWFWRDWESDLALKACSFAAQGLWMRMLCIAAQHDPTGYVAINSRGLDPEGVARIVGAGVDEVRSLIGELSLNGVFTRDRTGTIYNRRMVRDAKKAQIARRNGKMGGNPKLCNRSDILSLDKGMDMGDHKARDKLKPLPIPDKKGKKDINSNELISKENSIAAKSEIIGILETCLSKETASDLIIHRKAKRSPMTVRAAKLLTKAFVEFGDAERAAQTMIAQGWAGFKPEWMSTRPSRNQPAVNGFDDRPRALKYPVQNPVAIAREILDEKRRLEAIEENRQHLEIESK